MISEGLAGKRVFVTGSTGFVGTALVERLLRCVPDVSVVLLVRDGRRTSARRRVERELLRNDCFDRLRDELGSDGFAELATRVEVVAGDVSTDGLGLDQAGLDALATCDVVIHSAAAVAFDSPLDKAVEINLMGPPRIADTLNELGASPHLVAVSTCYVGGNHRGSAPEEPVLDNPFLSGLDWRAEVAAARRARADTDAESRSADRLAEFRSQARTELGPVGGPLLATRTENVRRDWVHDQMVDLGRARASSVGWPDAYAFTKALGEVALTERRGPLTVSIVRPSIIESSILEPRPGWIRGFRMAEPIILSYARGLLKEFPGVPEGVVDVIPVDLVVSAIVAAAANGVTAGDAARTDASTSPSSSEPTIIQVATGDANPLKYQQLVDRVREWFTEHPLYDRDGQPIVVPPWTFPGRGRVEGQLNRVTTTLKRTERVVGALPLRGRAAEWGATLEERRTQAERALTYVQLYGAYTECEAIYSVDNLLALDAELTDAERTDFPMDPRIVGWDDYITRIHLPSVVEHGRARSQPSKRTAENRSNRLRSQILSPERHAAFFDLENTIIASNVVASYAWLGSRRLAPYDRVRFVLRTLAEAPALLSQDRKDRSDFLRSFYRRYEDAPVEELTADAVEHFSDLLLTRSFPEAVRRVRRHRELGHHTVLITGALEVIIEPLLPLFDEVICARLGTRVDDRGVEVLTGQLTDVPPTAEARARILIDVCRDRDLDPGESVAYADSSSDLPMLEAVGFPVAVNPEPHLASIARKRGWLVEDFGTSDGFHHRRLPLAPKWLASTTGRIADGSSR